MTRKYWQQIFNAIKKVWQNACFWLYDWVKQNPKKFVVYAVLCLGYYFCLPQALFEAHYATVVKSREGVLLGAKIASDQQWRFPEIDTLPSKFETCLINFEDQYFYWHLGFNPLAMANAFGQNLSQKKVVRGGSTITQQVIRLHRKNKQRSYAEKLFELILATRLELRYSKQKILKLYASHAPFGGNVVGLPMASYRYFGLNPDELSWAESATLAVLPNSPSLIYPGKNQGILLRKRNRLLKKLLTKNIIDAETYQLAIAEPLPQKPYQMPTLANHFVEKVAKAYPNQNMMSSIDYELQYRVNNIAKQYHDLYAQNHVNNLAVLVVDIKTRKVVSYVGNAPTTKQHQKDVDMIMAARSTGSILKPFLYSAMLQDGAILPQTLVPDIPVQISGYTPLNYSQSFDGIVPVNEALTRSLNIPFVLMLQDYSVNKFYEKLKLLQQKNIAFAPDHYGLSLILGGAESSLWDLCTAYAYMASTLNHYNEENLYYKNEFQSLNILKNSPINFGKQQPNHTIFGAGAIYQTFAVMKELNRPKEETGWKYYDSAINIAWKTGTSFGGRDAWAIGLNKDYVVGVWVGNATGEGRPLLTGIDCSGPILFDVFRLLPNAQWFKMPQDDLHTAEVCKISGFLSQEYCPTKKIRVPKSNLFQKTCPYHVGVHTNFQKTLRVNASCEQVQNIYKNSWLVFPPVIEWYYRNKNPYYLPLPPLKEDCFDTKNQVLMDFVYPKNNTKITLAKDFSGIHQPAVFKVTHKDKNATLYWYINDVFLGSTQDIHEMKIISKTGVYSVLVVDDKGNEIKRQIEFVVKNL